MSGSSAEPSVSSDSSPGSVLSRPADEFVNDPLVESLWLTKAVSHMEIYFNLITSLPELKTLNLTKNDDIIYKTFREQFNDLDIKSLTENSIKCEEEKTKWRQFCNDMKEVVEDYNFATLLRLDSRSDYSESNTVIVPRAQFVAIEVARNREGINDGLNELFKVEKKS